MRFRLKLGSAETTAVIINKCGEFDAACNAPNASTFRSCVHNRRSEACFFTSPTLDNRVRDADPDNFATLENATL